LINTQSLWAHEYAVVRGALYFLADLPHAYRNRGSEATVAYLVMTYPQSVTY
jgi:hypothetical protein